MALKACSDNPTANPHRSTVQQLPSPPIFLVRYAHNPSQLPTKSGERRPIRREKQLEQYRAGKEALLGFFVGAVMRATQGQPGAGQRPS